MAGQAAAKAQVLRQAGEGLRLAADQAGQLQEITSLRGKLEGLDSGHKAEISLLQSRIDTLEADRASLLDKNKALQEKNRKLTQERKGRFSVFLPVGVVDRPSFEYSGAYIFSCSHRPQKIVSNQRGTRDRFDEYYVPSCRCCGEAGEVASQYG